MSNYNDILNQYPEFVSLKQLCQICEMTIPSGRYLIKNKIIPCVEKDDKMTWRYQIATKDIIVYLQRRERYGSMIPRGALTMPKKAKPKKQPKIRSAAESEVESYFAKVFADCPDVLTVADITGMTGLCTNTVRLYIKRKNLLAITEANNYYIPRDWFFDFISSEHFIKCESPSKIFKALINGFG